MVFGHCPAPQSTRILACRQCPGESHNEAGRLHPVVQPDAAWERPGEDAGGGERMRECKAVARAAPAGLTFLIWSSFSSVK